MSRSEEIANLSAADAAARIAEGSLTSQALVTACLDRIEAGTDLAAWAHVDREHALAQARRADEWRAAGRGTGPLHGVPIGIKDIIDTRDLPTGMGCPLYDGHEPRADAACVAALRAAGAVIIGKTVTTELALLTPAETVNPVARDRTPGGSSAGSAAAVSAGHVPAALGTQTAGSVLRPASYCGLYGFKPTLGLISRRGVLMQSHTLDTVGLLARSIADLALITDCMAAYDPLDAVSFERSQPRLAAIAAGKPPLAPTFAYVETPAMATHGAPAMREAFAELAGELGDNCQKIDLPSLANVIEWQRIVQLAENAAYYGPLQDKGRDQLSAGLNARLDDGARVPVRDYITAAASREKAAAVVQEIFDEFDCILTPAAPGPAPLRSQGITGAPIFNGLWTYLGMPCVSLPLLEVDGLPVGVQLVGPRRDDGRLLRTARWLVDHLMEGTGA